MAWKRSSYCAGGGNNCVEVAVREDDGIAIRDSVFPERVLRTSRAGLAALVAGVRDGRSGRLPG
ncbi:DUF397 domain-containing protein [Streptomyces sp. Ru87]|uniref:DUF397 domain-containing protein n=1 Tax=Streptomyces sp. Ru87 TaxID=2044307 RepID=UPI000BF3B153|nr:DUF397 domain-containing protein [Streptomyces sp. Ru87]PGH52677.1 DUF397 domain-containing protein [Streptomyces sp. Ru87]